MLVIRPEQARVFSRLMLDRFLDRMALHLRARFSERTEGLQDLELRAWIVAGIERAKRYRVKSEKDVRRYLECMMTHGDDFDRDSKTRWAGRILRRRKLTGTQRMEQIADYELFALKGKS